MHDNNLIAQDTEMQEMEKFFSSGGQEAPAELEPEVAPAPSPEPVDTNATETLPNTQQDHIANLNRAMQEEREMRKDWQRQAQMERERVQQMEQQLSQISARFQQAQQPAPPSWDEDPLGAMRYETERLKQVQTYQLQVEQQRMQQAQMQQAQQQFLNAYKNDATQFMQTKAPDFVDAYNHLVAGRLEEYAKAGYNQHQAQQLLVEDEMAIASKAYQDGVNPAERLYEVAKLRGYQAKVRAIDNQAQHKVQSIENLKNASMSLSNAGGGNPTEDKWTLESLQGIEDNDEFLARWDKVAARMR
jgi:hypothetical protein